MATMNATDLHDISHSVPGDLDDVEVCVMAVDPMSGTKTIYRFESAFADEENQVITFTFDPTKVVWQGE